MSEAVFLWLLRYALHSTVLVGAVLVLERTRLLTSREARETAWRLALFGAIATSLLQPTLDLSWPASTASPTAVLAPPGAATDRVASSRATVPMTGAIPLSAELTELSSRPADAAPTAEPAAVVLVPAQAPARRIVLAWAAFAAAGVLLTLLRLVRLWHGYARMPRCADAGLLGSLQRLSRRAGITTPAVAISPLAGSPLVLPAARLCVPVWILAELDLRQREAMLAHEVAHVLRRDPWWRLATELTCRALFFQPLNRLAARRLDALAELACDAWAARIAEGRALAECLVACAEHVHVGAPVLATAMAHRHSPLLHRIEILLEETPMQKPLRSLLTRAVLIAALPCALLLPAFGIERAIAAGHHTSIEIGSGLFGRYMSVDMDLEQSRLEAKIKGEVKFNDAEDDIASITRSGWIQETRGGQTWRIEFAAGNSGVERHYFVGGKEQPIDADGKRWLATIIPTLMREATLDVDQRVARIKARGGADAVLDEIGKIRSEYGRRSYVVALSNGGRLDHAQIARAIDLSVTIGGDYERRETLSALIENQEMDSAAQAAILAGVAKMDGDYEQRVVLVELAPKLSSDAAVVAAWRNAVGKLDSDYEAREAIGALSERASLTPQQVEAAIAAASGIKSDFEARTALSGLAAHVGKAPQFGAAYAKAALVIGSDYERREALNALLDAAKLDVDGYAAVLEAASGIGSDYECRSVLVEVAAHMPADEGLIKRYRAVARRLGDYERGQAEKALDRFAVL